MQQGREDFQALKKAWHDEKMKQLLQQANTTDLDQGTDAWTVNYQALLSAGRKTIPEQPASGDITGLESIDDATSAVDKFSNRDSELKIQPSVESLFPLSIEVARLKFSILREDNLYKIVTDSSDRLTKQVAEAANNISKTMDKLENLLVSIQKLDFAHLTNDTAFTGGIPRYSKAQV